MTTDKWTIVQHSGFGYGGEPGFEQAVETRQVSSKKEQQLVEKEHGILFNTYTEACDFEDNANDPSDDQSLYPRAKGSFSAKTIDGLRIYIPATQVIG